MQCITVSNFVPGRVMLILLPVGVALMLSIVGQFPLTDALSNYGNSVVSAVACNLHLLATLVDFFFEGECTCMRAVRGVRIARAGRVEDACVRACTRVRVRVSVCERVCACARVHASAHTPQSLCVALALSHHLA